MTNSHAKVLNKAPAKDLSKVPDKIQETVAHRLEQLGQRYTSNRKILVAILWAKGQPVTLPEMLNAESSLAQSSAYRNLVVLEEAQVVMRLVTTGQFARYELAEDLTGHHHHLICRLCGGVEDFTAPSDLERLLGKVVVQASTTAGFLAEEHRLDLIGTCTDCR